MCRVAIEGQHIRLPKSNAATGACQLNGFLKQPFRIADRARHKAGMHQIEASGRKSRAVYIAQHKFDIREPPRVRVPASVVEKDRIGVEADDAPGQTHTHAEKIRYAARTAAQIEAAPSSSHTDALQQNRCVRSKGVTLDTQSVNLAGPPLDRVITLRCLRHKPTAD